jgi:hypothetical protein
LPAGPGAFVAELIHGEIADSARHALYVRARTWLEQTKLEAFQAPLPLAVSIDRSIGMLLLEQARYGDAK